MTRYQYNSQLSPPAPFVHVTLRRPDRTREVVDIPAQLDTAADRSVVPSTLVQQLGLIPLGHVEVLAFGGYRQTSPTFLVQVEIRNLSPQMISVLTSPGEPFVILGRDVLNHFRLLLDGPHLVLEIG